MSSDLGNSKELQEDAACSSSSAHPDVKRKAISVGRKRPRESATHLIELAESGAPPAPRFDFVRLAQLDSEFRKHTHVSASGSVVVDFTSRGANLALTSAILRHHFDLAFSLPRGQLVPTIPNRVQYLRWAAGLLPCNSSREERLVLDVGTGPSCIYPLLGARLFPNWHFVATDTDASAISAARRNCEMNKLDSVTVVRTEPNAGFIPSATPGNRALSLTVCNPPFHAAMPETHNPAGAPAQLATDGGEYEFLRGFATESVHHAQVPWFTSLIGRKTDLKRIASFLASSCVRAAHVLTVELSQGGRTTRWAVAWSFGEGQSSAEVDETVACTDWRASLRVRTGRQYANQLTKGDMLDVFVAVLTGQGWVSKRSDGTSEAGKTILEGNESSAHGGAHIEAQVSERRARGDFEISVKVLRRGTMARSSLRDLCMRSGEEMVALLDCT